MPSLIIEIVSPGNANHDRDLKKQLYQRAQVPEYWIVDPDTKLVEQFVLKDREFVQQPSAGNQLPVHVLPGASVVTEGLWNFDF